ncbi:hypothetical protein FB567DRAFT_288068 [Paraphoma chrysanthemicola]|uniref:Uncharacterized protein n=1 Tax=Paraphoma chrysanthemicola TaxID=798071 RepID=A0A8K0RDG1_9PLEO|nr:hypothetical protein FB567DRAFT_288068 [Paraphoma chrysanthemicola]
MSAAVVDAETSSPHDSIAPTYPYVFRRVFHCGHPDELVQVSQLARPKRIMSFPIALEDGSQLSAARQIYSLERCRDCADAHFGADKRLSEHDQMTIRPRSMAAYQGAVLRQRDSVASIQDGFASVLNRLQEARRARHTPVSCKGDVGHAACAGAPDGGMYVKTLSVANKHPGLFGGSRQPSHPGAEMDPVPQLHTDATKDHDANVASGGRKPQVVRPSDGCGDVTHRRTCETNIAQRHCAASPDDQNKPRSTYAQASSQTYHSAVGKQPSKLNSADNPSTTRQQTVAHLEKAMENDSRAAHERDSSEHNDALIMIHPNGTAVSNSAAMTRWYESTPELDNDSESDRSLSEELEVPILSPDTFGIPSTEFTGVLRDLAGAIEPGFREVANRDPVAFAGGAHRSRFSWGSSIYSDTSIELGSEDAAWWTPRPLVVKKDVAPAPPPIPERNPLRLIKRRSQALPTTPEKESRASRNILNLRLDLSKPTMKEKRKSTESSSTKRKRSHTSKRKTSKSSKKESLLEIATPDHILEAMRIPGYEGIKHRRSVSIPWSRGPRRTKSHADIERVSENTEKTKGTRGHARGASEPFYIGTGSVKSRSSRKWDAVMPSEGAVRRSCITSLVNEHNERRPMQRLAINKELPPLPMAAQSS